MLPHRSVETSSHARGGTEEKESLSSKLQIDPATGHAGRAVPVFQRAALESAGGNMDVGHRFRELLCEIGLGSTKERIDVAVTPARQSPCQ
jgi:hypothetical protein